jgi:phospholipid transport system substrate-binding protein
MNDDVRAYNAFASEGGCLRQARWVSQVWKKRAGGILWGVLVLALSIHLGVALPALGAGPGPQDRVRATINAVSAVLEDPALQGAGKDTERRQRVQQIIFDAFDFQEMAKESLGTYWGKLTPEQREEFAPLFGHLFERSYNRLVIRFLGERSTLYGTESIQGERAVVQTTLISKQEARLPIDYQLVRHGEHWAIFDVVIDGVSLASNYRAQFGKILRTSSYDALVQRIKTKLDEEPL